VYENGRAQASSLEKIARETKFDKKRIHTYSSDSREENEKKSSNRHTHNFSIKTGEI